MVRVARVTVYFCNALFCNMQRIKTVIQWLLLLIVPLYFLLMIPGSSAPVASQAAGSPFAWNQDSLWQQLENDFASAKKQDSRVADSVIAALFQQAAVLYNRVDTGTAAVFAPEWERLLQNYFRLAAWVAAVPAQRDSFINYYSSVRRLVKKQSQQQDITSKDTRNHIYRVLYGMRAAAEEVLLQTAAIPFNPVMQVQTSPSATASANILGITVHSGDLLVSRGGAEVSALISRGNNYPGNFSHVALLYVEEKTRQPHLVEAHIEKGVAIASAEQYIKDRKLRFMVLRPRVNLPQLTADPLLPHKAAKAAYEQALSRHIPYDFKMNFNDSTALFCSEVASLAYRQQGVQLWQAESAISSQGVVNWLSDFGVENFVTQMPSDLEYDPQLSVVAEWRDPATLMKDHVDNAVMDALLEEADKGRTIGYNHWQLPMVRILKLYCVIKNYFGNVGMIPEGMSATRALKNQYFVAMYTEVRTDTEISVEQFIRQNGYRPPYWQLVAMAKKAAAGRR